MVNTQTSSNSSIIFILFLAFVMRYLISDNTSYWSDEFSSVLRYGAENTSTIDALRLLEGSVHPPFYYLLLYSWMDLFGTREVVTRFLSNIFVFFATLFLYVFALKTFGRRVALGTALVFSLMYMPIYYAGEVRSYALTLVLSTLSSLLMLYFLRSISAGACWKEIVFNKSFAFMSVVNACLILTHYYNIFFLASQAFFLLLYFVAMKNIKVWHVVPKVAAISIIPVILAFVAWGPVILRLYLRTSTREKYARLAEGASEWAFHPWLIFRKMVVDANFLKTSELALGILAVLVLMILVLNVLRIFRKTSHSERSMFVVYLFVWVFIPCVAASVYYAVQPGKVHPRYFIFCTPPLAVLVVLALEAGVTLLGRATSFLMGSKVWRAYVSYSVPFLIAASIVLLVPGAREAATAAKPQYRRIADEVVNMIRGDQGHKYLVYDTDIIKKPNINYYFERQDQRGRKIRAHRLRSVDRQRPEIEQYDFLVLTAPQIRTTHSHYAPKVRQLKSLYETHYSQLDSGRGYIVFDVRKKRSGARGDSGD